MRLDFGIYFTVPLIIAVALANGRAFCQTTHREIPKPELTQRSPQIASHKLDFSSATISIRESYDQTEWPIGSRKFLLTGANGRTQSLPLQPAMGAAGNSSLNLFSDGHNRYFLISVKDCVQFDPTEVRADYCVKRPSCDSGHVTGLVYLGRFDWMNGIDPPRGELRFKFRFLGLESAEENGSCPASSK